MITEKLFDWPSTVPASVQDKIAAVRDASSAKSAAFRGTLDEFHEARRALDEDRARLREMQRTNHPLVENAQKEVDRSAKILSQINARRESVHAEAAPVRRLSEALEQYVRSHSNRNLALHRHEAPQLEAGESAVDGLERAARRTRRLKADRQEVLAAPFPTAVAKEIAHNQIAARVAEAKPLVSRLIDGGENIEFPMSRNAIKTYEPGATTMHIYGIDPVGVLAWLFPSEMRAAIDREIDANGEDEVALSAEQRVERLAQIDGDILASEREEAAFAELAGLLPRPDIDPRAALGLADTMPAPKGDV